MTSQLGENDGIVTGCPLDAMLGFLAQAWMADIVYVLGKGAAMHFSALRRVLSGRVSAKMLSRRVKELESLGLVSRRQVETGRREVHYSLTDEGRKVDAAIRSFELTLGNMPLPEALLARS